MTTAVSTDTPVAPLSALQGIDVDERVIHVGTFSKVLFPALRVAYLVVPTWLVDAFTTAKGLLDTHSPVLEQATVAEFIAQGHFARHIARMRSLYRERQLALMSSARRHLQGILDVRPAATGMNVVAWLPGDMDDTIAARALGEAGIEVAPISAYRVQSPGPPGLILGFASTPAAEVDAATARLAKVVHKLSKLMNYDFEPAQKAIVELPALEARS